MSRREPPHLEGCAMLAVGFVVLCLTAVVLIAAGALVGVVR